MPKQDAEALRSYLPVPLPDATSVLTIVNGRFGAARMSLRGRQWASPDFPDTLANAVIECFKALLHGDQQAVLDFLPGL